MGIRFLQWALDDAPDDLPPLERLTLVSLADWARDDTGLCWPGRAALARRLRRSERTAGRMLTELTRRGLVEIVRPSAPGRHPVYRINAGQHVAHERGPTGDPRLQSTRDTWGPNAGHLGTKRGTPGGPPLHPQEPSGTVNPRARADEIAAVIRALRDQTGKTIDHHHAGLVIRQLVDGRNGIRDRIKYLTGAITKDPDPDRFLPTPGPPRYERDAADEVAR